MLLHGALNTYVSNPRTVAEQMILARPSLMVSVPRLYETVFATVHQKVAASAPKRAIFNWALKVGRHNQY
ncbi:MAG TPA: long-chain fatty acid--CoA ligase, partial [Savagea sp.]